MVELAYAADAALQVRLYNCPFYHCPAPRPCLGDLGCAQVKVCLGGA